MLDLGLKVKTIFLSMIFTNRVRIYSLFAFTFFHMDRKTGQISLNISKQSEKHPKKVGRITVHYWCDSIHIHSQKLNDITKDIEDFIATLEKRLQLCDMWMDRINTSAENDEKEKEQTKLSSIEMMSQ